jgi:hypothetical protein
MAIIMAFSAMVAQDLLTVDIVKTLLIRKTSSMPRNHMASIKQPDSNSTKCSFGIYKMAIVNQDETVLGLHLVFDVRGENLVLKSPHKLVGLFRQAQS